MTLHPGYALHKIAQIDIQRSDGNGTQHQGERHQHETQEQDRVAGTLGKTGNNQVGAGTHQTAIAAKARAQGQRPPERHERFGATQRPGHVLNNRDHGCHKGNVVDQGGGHG